MRPKSPIDEPEDELYLRVKQRMRADIESEGWSQREAGLKVLGVKKDRFEKWLEDRDPKTGKVRKIPITVMRDWCDYFHHNWELFSLGRLPLEQRKARRG